MNRNLRIPALCALVPLLCSGLYGVFIGAQLSFHYLSATPYPVSAVSALWAVFLGVLRGILTLICTAICARTVWAGRILPRHVIFPAFLVCLHLLSLLDPPVTTAGILQACVAVLALADMGILCFQSRTTGESHA